LSEGVREDGGRVKIDAPLALVGLMREGKRGWKGSGTAEEMSTVKDKPRV